MIASMWVQPLDDANRALLAHVRPADWRNPTPKAEYDLVVIGAGTAGLVSAAGAATLGARVALVERALLGGDCLNVGCVPSKALLRSARLLGELRRADALGVRTGPPRVEFDAVMRRMRQRRAAIGAHDAAARFGHLGVDVFFGSARFTNARTIEVERQRLRFRRAVIATGGRPTAPPVPGLDRIPYLTNENLFWLTELPRRLGVIGAGPIGCEMAQAFARFGSEVTLFDIAAQVLPREDADAAAIVAAALARDGVRLELGVKLAAVESSDGAVRVRFARHGSAQVAPLAAAPSDPAETARAAGFADVMVDRVLVAAGRAPNLEDLDLAAAGVERDAEGVVVSDRLQTTNTRVYAAGDVCSTYKFTHAADAMARIVLQNALFRGWRRASALVIPWCTYTDPEVAHVGRYERDARGQGLRVETITVPLSDVDRAVLDEEAEGFVRVHHARGRLLGATIVAAHAGELIGEVSYALAHRGSLAALSSTIHPYPTQAEALRKAGDAYQQQRLTPLVKKWLSRYFRATR